MKVLTFGTYFEMYPRFARMSVYRKPALGTQLVDEWYPDCSIFLTYRL